RGPQRLLARERGTAALRQHSELVIEPADEVLKSESTQANGCQFNCERNSVQAVAQLNHALPVPDRHQKALIDGSSSLTEERDRFVLNQPIERGHVGAVGQ